MPRKPTKKSLTNKLDKLCSKIVRSRGSCERCGNDKYEVLQACHIFSGTYRSVRWDCRYNILCLCAGCHFWAHKNPVHFVEWLKPTMGRNYEELKDRASPTKNWKVHELEELHEQLKKEFEEQF